MRADVVTIFPAAFAGPAEVGVLGRARARGRLDLRVHDLRAWAPPPHRPVDDAPYGGGAGMVFGVAPLAAAVEAVREPGLRTAVVLPSPAGETFDQALARELAGYEQLVLLCDRYEGSDERARRLATHELCLGDFVLTGGEAVAWVVLDAVARLLPGVVGDARSVACDSFAAGLLDHGHFTRPPEFRGDAVPEALRSGDHQRIEAWRRREALRRTLERRPDLLDGAPLGRADRDRLARERRFELPT